MALVESPLMHFIHDAHTTPRRRTQPLVWIQLERGGTRFPQRPVESSRFLIGSGTNCHLQLGGDIPLLHSLLVREQDGWTIDAVAPEPPLEVNGTAGRHFRLQSDDLVSVGPFSFRLLTPAAASQHRRSERPRRERT